MTGGLISNALNLDFNSSVSEILINPFIATKALAVSQNGRPEKRNKIKKCFREGTFDESVQFQHSH